MIYMTKNKNRIIYLAIIFVFVLHRNTEVLTPISLHVVAVLQLSVTLHELQHQHCQN